MAIVNASATLAGAGSLTAPANRISKASATLAGAGSLFARGKLACTSAGDFNQDYNDDFDICINRWPSSLPQCPLLDGFTETKQANVVSFKPDVGTVKYRRRCSSANWVASMAFKFNELQLQTFERFRRLNCEDGAAGFQMLHPVTKVNYWWHWNKKEAPVIQRVSTKVFIVRFDVVNLKAVA